MTENIEQGASGSKGLSRRQFLVGTGAAAGAFALFGAPHLSPSGLFGVQLASAQTLNNDLDILNFALTLEYVETSAYNYLNSQNMLTGRAREYALKFGENENTHVAAIVQTIRSLGGTPINPPATFNLPAFANETAIVRFLIESEEVGAGAYLGAAPLIRDRGILAAAAAFHNVEGQHASGFKALLEDMEPSPAFGMPLTPPEVVAKLTAAYGPNSIVPGPGTSPRAVVGGVTSAPVPPPGGVGTTGGTVGMPRTGAGDALAPVGIAAAMFAAAVGAMLRIRTRNVEEAEQQQTNQ